MWLHCSLTVLGVVVLTDCAGYASFSHKLMLS